MNDLGYKYRLFAEVVAVEEQASNDVYMQVEMRMMSTAPNGNGCVIEREFMEAVVENTAFYIGTPVKVDIAALVSGRPLGHRFDKKRKEWLADQVGAITEFSLKEEDGETVMYGKARIEKGRADVCEALVDLYEDGKLFFSFEITAKDIVEDEKEGLIHIGASENNHLTAMCVVSVPAYDGATAITFVAEMENDMEKTINYNDFVKWAAELEVPAVHCKVFDLLYSGPLKDDWHWECRELGVDYMLLKNFTEGTYKKVMFHVENDEVILDEVFDVEITRVGAPAEEEAAVEAAMDEEEKTESEEEEVKEDAASEEESEEEPAKEDAAEESEEEPVKEEAETEEEEEPAAEEPEEEQTEEKVDEEEPVEEEAAEETDEEIEEMKKELEELRRYRDEAEAEKQRAEKEAEVSKLRYAAEKLGIDSKELSEAIENLDYQKVMASLNIIESNPDTTTTVNGLVGDGIQLRKSRWAELISDATGLGE